jgi:hypothetical protein
MTSGSGFAGKNRMKKIIYVIPLILLMVIAAVAQNKTVFRYGNSFQLEEPIKNPVKLPKRVLSRVYKGHTYHDQSINEFEKTVAGTFIDLGGDKHRDFLVQGDSGANITGFWLFRNVGEKQELVLNTRALGINLLGTRHKGLRDIGAAAATAITLSSVIFHFNGTEYRPYRCWSEDLGQESKRPKRTFYRCRT